MEIMTTGPVWMFGWGVGVAVRIEVGVREGEEVGEKDGCAVTVAAGVVKGDLTTVAVGGEVQAIRIAANNTQATQERIRFG